MENNQMSSLEYFDLTPAPQLLQILGDLKFKGWQCIAELIDNSIDAIIKSENLPVEYRQVNVSIPTPSKIKENTPLIIEDFADGMDGIKLQNAVRAGFSGKNTKDSIGLFGMGFNIATACLANSVEVWTSTKDMDVELGVLIDLREMAQNKSFIRKKLERPKHYNKKSGTEIKIYDFKKDAESLLRVRDIVDNLNRAYTERIFNEQGINIKINQYEIKPFNFCVWSENVTVEVSHREIPGFIRINEILKQENFCENCFSWLGNSVNTNIKIECPYCHSSDQIVKKDIQLFGWVGIQRYPDPDHYGIDISRNGRILKKLDKSFFNWDDERGRNDIRFNPEYPRDNPMVNGRIVGQIEANFIHPKYTKDDFNTDDLNWKLVVKYLRGEMPLQTNLGELFGYKGNNESPIGKLFRGYRRIDPPGRKTLMFAKRDGSGKSDPARQKNWRDKFYEGDINYIDEKKWLEEIDKSELKETTSTFNPINPVPARITSPDQIQIKSPNEEKYPGNKIWKKSIRYDIENIIGEKPIEITLLDYYPTNDIKSPIIFESQGAMWKFNVYINQLHPMFYNFADGYQDLLFMEVAIRYALVKNNSEEWTLTRIYYELKSKYAPETMLSVSNLVSRANKLMRDIHTKLVIGEGVKLAKLPNLSVEEKKIISNKFLNLENKVIDNFELFIQNTKFLNYIDFNYLFKFVDEFPEVIYDGKILDLSYSNLDEENKNTQLKKYSSYFNDVRWFMNDLSNEGDETVKKLKQQIIASRYSLDILYGSIIK